MAGDAAFARLLCNYADGMPQMSLDFRGQLVSLRTADLPLSPEDEAAYAELVGQFFGRRAERREAGEGEADEEAGVAGQEEDADASAAPDQGGELPPEEER